MTHSELIVALGDTSSVADALGLKDTQVSNWKQRGVSWRYRHKLAKLAKRKRVELPADFLS